MNVLQKLALWTAQKAGEYGGFTFSVSEHNPKLSSYFTGGATYTGKAVSESSALQVTSFFACIRLLAETMGAMPSAVFAAEKSGNAVKADDHPLHEILVEQPNADMNGVEFREASTSNLSARGNAYSIIERRESGDVISLYPVPSARMTVKRNDAGAIVYQVEGEKTPYPAEKIWHRKGFSFDGLMGLSPIACAREALGLALAGEEFNARLFGQGLVPSALVSIPNWLTDEQRKVANARLLEMHTGAQNLRKPMLLEGGMKVESGLMTPDDAQFLQLRQFTVVEICRMLGVKPHMIAALERATDNNIEKLSLEFVMYTMLPHMRRDEVAARQLFKPADKSKYFYRYNFEGLLRADSVARAQLYSILLQNGVFNRNETRALENRNAVDDPAMDAYTVQSNMAMIDQLAAMVAARQAPPAPSPQKAGDVQNFSVHLPESVKHVIERKQEVTVKAPDVTVTVPGMRELAEAVTRSAELAQAAAEKTTRAVDDLKALSNKPRKAVFDALGNPIGVEIVDTLH